MNQPLADPSPPDAAPRRRAEVLGAWALRATLIVAALSAVAVALAWLVLQWAILPRIDEWRPELERRATQALGVDVRIGAIAVDSTGGAWRWARAIELREVVLMRPPQATPPTAQVSAEGLRLPRVRAALSPASLLPGWDGRWRLRFDQLVIEAAQLDVRREADGRILLAGFEPRAGGQDGDAADWFFSQHEFVIRGARVVWTDGQRGLAPVAFSAVDLVVRNGVRRHALRLDATPPAAWGARFSLQGEFTQPIWGGGVRPAPTIASSASSASATPTRAPSLLARPGDWRRWRGQLYAELPALDIEPVRAHLDAPVELLRGHGAVRAWLDVDQASAQGFTVDLALRDLALRVPHPQGHGTTGLEPAPLNLSHLDGRMSGRIEPAPAPAFGTAPTSERRAELRARALSFAMAEGPSWPAADLDLALALDAQGQWTGGALKAPRLDLGLVALWIERLPAAWLGEATQAAVSSLAPQGAAESVDAQWQGPLDALRSYAVKARVRGLGLASAAAASQADDSHPDPGRPGVKGLDVDLKATEAGGEATLAMQNGEADFPGVFAATRVPLDRFTARLDWTHTAAREGVPGRWDVRAREVRVANADAQGEFTARWQRGAETAALGALELQGRLVQAQATSVARYLPLGLPADVRRYVERAVQGGVARTVDFGVRGDLRDFPFGARSKVARTTADGRAAPPVEFRIAAQLEGVGFAYMPGDEEVTASATGQPAWPAFTDVKGELIFDRQSMELRRLSGRLGSVGRGGFEVSGVNGSIRDLVHDATLGIEGTGRGPLADALAFIRATPVDEWIGGALTQAELPAQARSGAVAAPPMELKLALQLPLNDIDKSTVRGSVALAGQDLRLRPDLPELGQARAQIEFTERDFKLSGAARLLGGEATLEGLSQPDGSVRVSVAGVATAEGLRRWREPVATVGDPLAVLSGQTSYRLGLGFAQGQAEWLLTSKLAGLGFDLPAPLRKSAEAEWPLRVQSSRVAAGAAGAARELLRVDLGPEGERVMQAAWLREAGPGRQDTPRVVSGAWAVGAELPALAEGVTAQVVVDHLDLDAWRAVTARGAVSGDGPVAAPPTTTAASARSAAARAYLPSSMALRAPSLTVAGRRLHRVVAGITRGRGADEGLWRVNVEAAELNGSGEYRAPGARGGGTEGRVQAHLARLVLPRPEPVAAGDAIEAATLTQAARLPALDITVDEMELGGKRLGRIEIEAVNRLREGASLGDAAALEWRLDKLRMTLPEARLTATGLWGGATAGEPAGAASGRRRAQMDFTLDVADGGALLARLGQPDVIKAAKGQITGKVQWNGSPLAIDYPSLAGALRVDFEEGQFLKAEPGIAKLLGVLSLQSLPRRLLLDFRDVFEQGFAFDRLDGEIQIAQGVASTRKLRTRGVQATVLMEGRADLARETQDLHVWVVPEINAGTASLAVAAINPAIGIGSFLAQLFLRGPLIEAGTREFRISGPWTEPKVERVERTGAAPSDAASTAPAEPASAPSEGEAR